jgi:hypothetical protein
MFPPRSQPGQAEAIKTVTTAQHAALHLTNEASHSAFGYSQA